MLFGCSKNTIECCYTYLSSNEISCVVNRRSDRARLGGSRDLRAVRSDWMYLRM